MCGGNFLQIRTDATRIYTLMLVLPYARVYMLYLVSRANGTPEKLSVTSLKPIVQGAEHEHTRCRISCSASTSARLARSSSRTVAAVACCACLVCTAASWAVRCAASAAAAAATQRNAASLLSRAMAAMPSACVATSGAGASALMVHSNRSKRWSHLRSAGVASRCTFSTHNQ